VTIELTYNASIKQPNILWKFHAPWTWVDFYDALDEQRKLLAGVSQRIDLIVDLNDAYPLPKYLLQHFFFVAHNENVTPFKDSYMVVVGANAFLRMIGAVMLRHFPMAGHGLRFATSQRDAADVLTELYLRDDYEKMMVTYLDSMIPTPSAQV